MRGRQVVHANQQVLQLVHRFAPGSGIEPSGCAECAAAIEGNGHSYKCRAPPNILVGSCTVSTVNGIRVTPLLKALPAPRDALANSTDDELVALAVADTLGALDTLVRRHQARVLRIASRYLSDTTLVEDVAQCAFLELLRSYDRYERRGRFSSYLYRIVINQCRMAGRKERAARRQCAPTSIERAQESSLPNESLQRALSQLSEKLRSVVVLRYAADLDLAEIAETLDVPIGTVKRRLFDAMAKLRELMVTL
jgi:RNA polymerase sigma-70 factor (ECF subfamily)